MADDTTGSQRAQRRRKEDRQRPWVQATRLKVRKWLNEPHSPLWRLGLLAGISGLCALVLASERPRTPAYGAGEIAPRTVWARKTYRIPDKELTEAKRKEAEASARPVYDFDPDAHRQTIGKLADAFAAARAAEKPKASAAFSEASGINGNLLQRIERTSWDSSLEQSAISLLASVGARRIVARTDLIATELAGGVSVRNVGGGAEITLRATDGAGVVDLDAARSLIYERANLLAGESSARRELAAAIAHHAIRPNLTFNAAETEARRQRALSAVNEVFIVIQKGRAVVEAGHEVTEQHARLLAAMRAADRESAAAAPFALVGLFVLSASVLAGVWAFGKRYMRRIPTGTRDLAVLGSLVLLGLMLARLAQLASGSLPESGMLSPAAVRFSVPSAAAAIVAAVLLGPEGAALVAVSTALLSGLALEGDLRATIYLFIGSIAAAGVLALPQRRTDLLKAGFAAGVTQLAMIAAYALFDAEGPTATVSFRSLAIAAFGSGVLAGVLALALVPVYEIFGYLTNFKLLELASLGSPLLKELSVQAPGTYHHSVVVGSLAEAGAETVGANPLFARVACYYHDIGKMKKPQYFIENQQGAENVHEKLTPSMSALVVESHVKDGVEMGLAHGLPKAIVDVIPQHHGTRLISFFYRKAQEQAAKEEAGEVVEADFRYPGPKPQSREAGIIMLADGTEAATRSISEPTPAKIRAMIHKVFGLVQNDGQLDECDLSLRDLARIAESFEKVVLGMHHKRVAYPMTADISSGGTPTGASSNVVPMRKPDA